MTVSSTTNRVVYTGDGGTVAFPVTFPFFVSADLQVIERVIATGAETTKTLTTHYTVTGGSGSTGTVTAVAAPAGTVQWVIKRVLPRTQAMDLTPNSAFPANTVEAAHDKAVMLAQELDEVDARSLKFPATDSSSLSATLPSSVSRASKYLAFDSSGAPVTTSGTANAFVVSTFAETLLDDVDQAAMQATLGIVATAIASDGEALTGTDTAKILPVAIAGGWLGRTLVPGGRCSLTTALPVTTADVLAATTIYYALHEHNLAELWNGTRWQVVSFAELSLVLDSDAGHTGYHQSGKNFDLFLYDDAGTIRLGSSPAWATDTSRADALGRKDGRLTNNASIVLRFGNAAGNTTTVAANRALWVGMFRASAGGQTEDSKKKRFLWNAYHQRLRQLRSPTETTDSWAYATATWRQARASTSNQVEFVIGASEHAVLATAHGIASNSNSETTVTGIGLDSTTTLAADSYPGVGTGTTSAQHYGMTAVYKGFPGIGYHYLAQLEYADANAVTATWYGDAGIPTVYQSGIHGEAMG